MITFLLLFIIWIINDFKYQATRTSKEKIFYFFVLMYGLSQFVSLINSPLPYESIKQGIIVGSLLTVIIVVSETVFDRKMLEKVLIAMGITSLIIGVLSVISHYFIVGDFNVRLGQGDRTLGIIGLGGDTFYFGDILLYSIGSVYFVLFKIYDSKYWKYSIPFLLMLWFSAVVLTFSKALIMSVIFFLFAPVCY